MGIVGWFAATTACAAGAKQSGSTSGNGGTGSGGGSASIGAGAGSFTGSSTSGSSSGMSSPFYVHTNTTLFEMDPTSLALSKIGDFDCIGKGSGQESSMTDVAVDDVGDVYAVSAQAVHKIEISGSNVHCATSTPLVGAKVSYYALTFAPQGTIDANKEVLVAGNTAGELWAIDDQGNQTLHGTLGVVPSDDGNGHSYSSKHVGKPWELSGDLVFLSNNGSPVGFATVRDCPNPPSTSGCNTTDTLVEVDVTKLANASGASVLKSIRGQIIGKANCPTQGKGQGYGAMYGIAAIGDKVFGFSHQGDIVQIDNKDGSACLLMSTTGDAWAGAGVTTVAPVVVPPPK